MAQLRLAERLLYATAPRLAAGQSRDSLVKKSIMDHLSRLLNTRKGSVPIDPAMGMSDMSNIAGSFAQGTTQIICQEVVEQINQYEPRLRQPKVATSDLNLEREVITLKFEIRAFMADDRDQANTELISMTMRINSHGFVKLALS